MADPHEVLSTIELELRHSWEFVISEANGNRSRGEITLLSGENLEAGTVLGVLAGVYREWDPGAVDGTEVAVAILGTARNAVGANVIGVAFIRDGEVNQNEIEWSPVAGATSGEITAAIGELALQGIIVRGDG